MSPTTYGIVFSYNRAMQLDATLRSFYLHCKDADSILLTVLFRADTPANASQYRTLAKEYPDVIFYPEKSFRHDTIKILIAGFPNPLVRLWLQSTSYLINTQRIYFLLFQRTIKRLACKMQESVACRKYHGTETAHILFLVDDNIFVRDFSISDCIQTLELNPEALGFSLRLGRNTTYSYTKDHFQTLPSFKQLNEKVLSYAWPNADYSFGYPLEVSSSIYRAHMICPLVASLRFHQPNKLESKMAACRRLFQNTYPRLLCFETSVTFCNPLNMVQQVSQNRAGESVALTVSNLCERFERGERINVKVLDNFIPKSCHQEVEFEFTNPYIVLGQEMI